MEIKKKEIMYSTARVLMKKYFEDIDQEVSRGYVLYSRGLIYAGKIQDTYKLSYDATAWYSSYNPEFIKKDVDYSYWLRDALKKSFNFIRKHS